MRYQQPNSTPQQDGISRNGLKSREALHGFAERSIVTFGSASENLRREGSMTHGETLISVWRQSLANSKEEVDLGGESVPVSVFRTKKLPSVELRYCELRIMGFEQDPHTAQWAALAI